MVGSRPHGYYDGADDDPFVMQTVDKEAALDIVRDPVCGELIARARATGVMVHCQKVYYFCCDDCREEFLLFPRRFAA